MTNSQITDSVRLAQLFTIGGSPSQTLAMLNAVMTETLGMGMHNAISVQHNSQMVSAAASTSTCARLLSIQAVVAPPPPPPPPAPATTPAAQQTFTLTVVGGTGSGPYAANASVPIAANTPPAGQVFKNWSGAVVSDATSASTVLAMPSADTTVTANFVAGPQFALAFTVSPSGGGTCTSASNGNSGGSYAAGETVSITATPSSGYTFGGWTGGTGVNFADATSATTTLSMPAAATTLTATFNPV